MAFAASLLSTGKVNTKVAMRLNNMSCNGQPETGALLVLASMGGTLVKPVKNSFHLLGRNSHTGVSDAYLYPGPPALLVLLCGGGYADGPACWGKFHGIAQQVRENLVDFLRIDC
jgi:hypothetical protein